MVSGKSGEFGVSWMKHNLWKYNKICCIVLLLVVVFIGCKKVDENVVGQNLENQESLEGVEFGSLNNMDNLLPVVTIDSTKTYQVVESFGTSGCWWSQYVGLWNNTYRNTERSVRDEIAMLLFDKDYGIGLTSYRYNLGAGSKESGKGNFWDPHRRASSFETAPFTYNWNRDKGAVWFLKKAVELGVEEVVLFSNSPLERLTVNGLAHMSEGQKVNILKGNYDDFARYVMDVAEHFVVEEGIPVKFISPINEPQWDWYGGQEGCHFEPHEIPDVYKAFLAELEKRPSLSGVSLSGPESGEWKGDATAYTSALLNNQTLKPHFTSIDNHSYWSDAQSKIAFKSWMNAHHPDVTLRMSEWCEMVNGSDYTMDSAFHLAEVLVEDLTILDVVAWQNWVAVAPGGYRDGLIYVNENEKSLQALKRLWGYGNYTRFIRPGYQRVDISFSNKELEELKPVAFIGTNDRSEEEIVLVFINQARKNQEFLLNLDDTLLFNQLSIYETSKENDLALINQVQYDEDTTISLNAMSITTLVLSNN